MFSGIMIFVCLKKHRQEQGFYEIFVAITLVVLSLAIFLIINSTTASEFEAENAQTPVPEEKEDRAEENSATPTPFPFSDMTIPDLRARDYVSSLGDLQEYSDNSNYTSYVTSYDSDGLKIYGLLTKPKGEMPARGWPAVVFVHGYIPPQEYSTTQKYNDYVNYLANRGLVVFKIDLRGHGSSEGQAFGAYYSSDYIIDTLNAHAALQSSGFVDPERIGLWGHSMAGNVVFRSFVARPEVKKVVIWAGAVYTYEDFQDFRIQDTSYQPPSDESERRQRREKLFNTHGEFDPEDDFWKQIVPTNYLDGVDGAVHVHHAINDSVVDIRYSRNLMQVLEGTRIEHELFEYISGGHNLTGVSFTQAMQRTADFYLN